MGLERAHYEPFVPLCVSWAGMGRFGVDVVKYAPAILYSPSAMSQFATNYRQGCRGRRLSAS